MEGIWIVVFILLGISVGSFLNVCIDRLPNNESLLSPGSHCASCQHHLGIRDLVPVFSYLWLRGRCRYCQAPVSGRLLWVEIGIGLVRQTVDTNIEEASYGYPQKDENDYPDTFHLGVYCGHFCILNRLV
jgi:hypothetical protein